MKQQYRIPSKDRKTKRVAVYLTASEEAALKSQALMSALTTATYARELLRQGMMLKAGEYAKQIGG